MVTFALIGWVCCYIPTLENSIMELREDTLVDLKFIMADTGFGKTYIYDRVKDGTLCKPIKISGRSRWKYRDHLEFKNKLISGCGG